MYRRQHGELGTKLAQSKNRNKIKRHWPSYFKRLKLQEKAKRNLESDPSYHLLTKALKKESANDSLRDVFIQ